MGNPRRTNGTRRDRLIRRIKREETHCHLCGQPVDVRLPHGLPASPEIDELIPVKLGGNPYDRANCRLAHRWCNRQRWHKPYLPERRLLHADPPQFDTAGQLTRPGGRDKARRLEPIASREW